MNIRKKLFNYVTNSIERQENGDYHMFGELGEREKCLPKDMLQMIKSMYF